MKNKLSRLIIAATTLLWLGGAALAYQSGAEHMAEPAYMAPEPSPKAPAPNVMAAAPTLPAPPAAPADSTGYTSEENDAALLTMQGYQEGIDSARQVYVSDLEGNFYVQMVRDLYQPKLQTSRDSSVSRLQTLIDNYYPNLLLPDHVEEGSAIYANGLAELETISQQAYQTQAQYDEQMSGDKTLVGELDNSTGYDQAFSNMYVVSANETLHLEFVNYSDKAATWHNWVAVVGNGGAAALEEYFRLRADAYGWGTYYSAGTLTSNYNWDTFTNDMDGANVILELQRNGSNVTLNADVTTVAGSTYNENFTVEIGDGTEDISLMLTTENGHLIIDNEKTQVTVNQQSNTLSLSVMGRGMVTLTVMDVTGGPGDQYLASPGSPVQAQLEAGKTATLTLTPYDSSGLLLDLTVNGTSVLADVYDNTYYLQDTSTDQTIVATFSGVPLNLINQGNGLTRMAVMQDSTTEREIEVASNAEMRLEGQEAIAEGSRLVFNFEPESGYQLAALTVDTSNVFSQVTGNSYTIDEYNFEQTITATYEPVPVTYHRLTLSAGDNGTIVYVNGRGDSIQVQGGQQSFDVEEGTRVPLRFVPDAGYYTAVATVGNDSLGHTDILSQIDANGDYAIDAFAASSTVAASFYYEWTDEMRHELMAARDSIAMVLITADNLLADASYPWGKTQLRNVRDSVIDTSNSYLNIIDGNGQVVSPATFSETQASSILSSTAILAIELGQANQNFVTTNQPYVDLVNAIQSAQSLVNDSNYAQRDATELLAAIASAQALVNAVTETPQPDEFATALATLQASMDSFVSSPDIYTFNITSEGNGRVSLNGTMVLTEAGHYNGQMADVNTLELTFTPAEHFYVESLTVNGVNRLADLTPDAAGGNAQTLTIDNVSATTTVFVRFSQIYHTLTLNATEHGHISMGDSIVVSNGEQQIQIAEGTSVPLTIVADAGYHLGSVLLNGESIADQLDDQGRYTIASMNEDVTVAATFGQTFHTLAITASGNGRAVYDGTGVRNGTLTFSVAEGSTAKIALRPDTYNYIERVTVNGVAATPVNDTLTIANITDSTAVTVAFAQSSTTLAITSEGNGSVALNGTQVLAEAGSHTANVTAGEPATLTFTPSEHYMIDSLTVNGISRISELTQSPEGGTAQVLTLSVDSASSVYVHFGHIMHTLTVSVSEHGALVGLNQETGDSVRVTNQTMQFSVGEGAVIPMQAVPDAGYHLGALTINGVDAMSSVDERGNFVLPEMTSDQTVTAIFGQTFHTLAITATGNGRAVYDGTGVRNGTLTFSVAEGSTAKIALRPDTYNYIERVTVNGVAATPVGDTLTIANITDSTSVVVAFAQSSTTLAVTSEGNGTVALNGTQVLDEAGSHTASVTAGEAATLTFTPAEHYVIDSLTVNGVSRLADLTLSPTSGNAQTLTLNVDSATTVYVHFGHIMYTLTVSVSEHGALVGLNQETGDSVRVTNQTMQFSVGEGAVIPMQAVPDAGYHLGALTINGVDAMSSVDERGNFVLPEMTSDQTVTAIFGQTFHTLAITATGNGRAVYDGTGVRNGTLTFSVAEGSTAKIALRPDTYNYIERVTVNGVAATPVGDTLTIANITDSTSVVVAFAQSSTTLAVTSEGSGTVALNGSQVLAEAGSHSATVAAGEPATLTFTPAEHYVIDSLTVNGVSRLAELTQSPEGGTAQVLTLSVDSASSVYVHFGHIMHTLTLNATEHGSITCGDSILVTNGERQLQVAEGASVALTITADAGYHLGSVLLNGESIADQLDAQGRYTILSMDQDVAVSATFGQTFHTLAITASGNGRAIFDGTGIRNGSLTFSVPEGETAKILVRPDANNRVESVTVNGVATTLVGDTLIIPNITDSTAVDVVFALGNTTLAITATGNGRAIFDGTGIRNGSLTFSVPLGEPVKILVRPDANNIVESATVNGVASTLVGDTLIIPNIMDSVAVNIIFAPATFDLSVLAEGDGTVLVDSSSVRREEWMTNIPAGYSPTLTFVPDAHSVLDSLTVNGVNRMADLVADATRERVFTLQLDGISASTSVYAHFSKVMYTLTVNVSDHGAIVGFNEDTGDSVRLSNTEMQFSVLEGTVIPMRAVPDAGYHLGALTVNGVDAMQTVDADGNFVLPEMTGDMTVAATFGQSFLPFSILASGNGEAIFNGTVIRGTSTTFQVPVGSTAKVYVKADKYNVIDPEGAVYVWEAVDGAGGFYDVVNDTVTITNITDTLHMEVTFVPQLVPLTITSEGQGTVSNTGSEVLLSEPGTYETSIEAGNSATFVFRPAEHYAIDSLSVNGISQLSNLGYVESSSDCLLTLDSISDATSIYVRFSQIMHTLTLNAGEHGRIAYTDATGESVQVRNGEMQFQIADGAPLTLNVQADAGYSIGSVLLNGESIADQLDADGNYTLNAMLEDVTVSATFGQNFHPLAITATGNGRAEYNGTEVRGTTTTFQLGEGASAAVFVKADTYNYIENITVNGQTIGSEVAEGSTVASATLVGDTLFIRNITAATNVDVTFSPIIHELALRSYGYGTTVARGDSLTGNRAGDVELRNERRVAGQSLYVEEGDPLSLTLIPEEEYYVQHVVVTVNGMTDTLDVRQVESVEGPSRYVAQMDTLFADALVEVSFSWSQDSALVQSARDHTYIAEEEVRQAADYVQAQNWPWYRQETNERLERMLYYIYENKSDIEIYTYDEGPGSTESMPSRPVWERIMQRAEMARAEVDDARYQYQSVNEPYANLVALIGTARDVMADPQYVLCDPQPLQVVVGEADSLVQQTGEEPQTEEFQAMFTRLETAIEAFKNSKRLDGETFLVDGITYRTTVADQHETFATVVGVSDMAHVTIPNEVTHDGFNWTVTAVADSAFAEAPSLVSVSLPSKLSGMSSAIFANNSRLSAIDWQSDAPLELDQMSNPNLLVYVNDLSLAPANVRNVVVGDVADEIVLSDSRETLGGFHPLRPFTARSIRYSHNYMLETPLHGCEGWETLSLPFNVETIEHETKGRLAPFAQEDESAKHFWLYGYGEQGFERASEVEAYKPYIISMPNNRQYNEDYRLSGYVTFSASNALIEANAPIGAQSGNVRLVPTMQFVEASDSVHALNISGEGGERPGSTFIAGARNVRPFQVYARFTGQGAPQLIPLQDLLDGNNTAIDSIMADADQLRVKGTYDLGGRKVDHQHSLRPGVYVNKGKKVVVK